MRILFFTENLRAGGKERRIIELFKYLKKHGGYELELVITKNIIHYQEIYELGIPIHLIERKWTKKDPLLFFKFFKIARRFKPDIIHVWGHMVAVYAIPSKLLLNIPLINNEIVDATQNEKLIGKGIVFNNSDRIIANTQAGLIAYDAPMQKSRVIYNGFSFDRIKDLERVDKVRARFGVKTAFVVGMVASFLKLKDYDTYIKAAIKILSGNSEVTFLCIGDGDDSEYKKMVPDHLNSNILFLGRQSHVESIMQICDVGVLTTNIKFHGEGISNALLEFMAVKKPVVTTNFGGSSELVEDGKSGYLIDAFNVEQLVEKLEYLRNHKEVGRSMGERGYQIVKEKFSMDAMFNSFQEEYKNAMEKSGRRA